MFCIKKNIFSHRKNILLFLSCKTSIAVVRDKQVPLISVSAFKVKNSGLTFRRIVIMYGSIIIIIRFLKA